MQVWNLLHAAYWKYRTQKIAKKSASAYHRITLSGYIYANIKHQYLPHTSSQYGELRPTSSWDRFGCLAHPSKFQRVSRLGFVTAATSLNKSQPNFARCLAVSYIHFRGLLPHNGILPGEKFTLRPSLALSYIGSVTARHSSSGRQTNFVALSRRRHLYLAGRPSRWALAHIPV